MVHQILISRSVAIESVFGMEALSRVRMTNDDSVTNVSLIDNVVRDQTISRERRASRACCDMNVNVIERLGGVRHLDEMLDDARVLTDSVRVRMLLRRLRTLTKLLRTTRSRTLQSRR